jgi:preprotein translocase subunit SecA
VVSAIDAMYDAVSGIGVPIMRHVEKDIMLKVLDQQWREHLAAWITAPGDHLRQR